MSRFLVGAGLVAVLAVPAVAQAQGQDSKVVFRPMIGAVVGSGPGAAVGAALGFKASDKIQIHGEFGRLTNIMPNSVAEQVEVQAALKANALNGKHSATASASASYGMIGLRRALREVNGAQTFVEFGVGMARVDSKIDAVIRGSETLQGSLAGVTTAFTNATPETKPMVAFGGGMILPVTRGTAVEIGARYVRVMTEATSVNMSNIFGGYRFSF